MGRKVGRNLGGARRGARTGIGIVGFAGLAAVVLSACFAPAPKPNPPAPPAPPASSTTSSTTTTTTTTPPPPAAHLSVSPDPMSFTSERTAASNLDSQIITVTNTGSAASGPVATTGATDLSGLAEPGHPTSGAWLVGSDDCEGTSLAPGGSCHIQLAFGAGVTDNRSWTGDFVAQAAPGGVVHVAVAAHVTSKLEFADFTELDATPLLDGTTHLVIANVSGSAIGPIDASLTLPGTTGTFGLATDNGFGVPACTQHMTLAAGASCQWEVTYHNTTGGGVDGSGLKLDAGTVQATAGFMGFGKP